MLSTTLATLAPILSSINVANTRRRIVHGTAIKVSPIITVMPTKAVKKVRVVKSIATPDDMVKAVIKARSVKEKVRLLLLACEMGTR